MYIAFSKGLKAGLSLVAIVFAFAILLTNYLTCLQGNQTSKWFVVDLPSLEEYLLVN
jgi:hypothetical protein